MTWDELLAAIRALIDQEHAYRTLVIDTLNGAERLCHEHVCRRDFGGRWGRDGFTAYMTGYEVALADWRELLGPARPPAGGQADGHHRPGPQPGRNLQEPRGRRTTTGSSPTSTARPGH